MQIKSEHRFREMAKECIFSQMPELNSSFNYKDSLFYDDFKSMTAGSSFGFYLD